MTQDLTKITTAFGLLDEETQNALKNCGGPWQRYNGDSWVETDSPAFGRITVYRQKPAPREYVAWQILHRDGLHFAIWPSSYEKQARKQAEALGGFVVKLTGVRDE